MVIPESLNAFLLDTNQIAETTEVFDLVEKTLAYCMKLVQASSGIFFLVDASSKQLVVQSNQGEASGLKLTRKNLDISDSFPGECLENKRVLTTFDFSALDAQNPRHLDMETFVGHSIRNAVSLSLLCQNRPVGVIQLYNYQQLPVDLLEFVAGRMAPELDKLMYLLESRNTIRRLESLIGIMGGIGSTLDPTKILQLIIEDASNLLNVEASSLFLIDKESGDVTLQLSSNKEHTSMEHAVRVPAGKGVIGYVVQTGETVIVNDAKADIRHYTGVDSQVNFNTRSILAVPLKSHPINLGANRGSSLEQIIGGLEAINKRDGLFDAFDIKLMQSFASQAATVFQIAQMYKEANDLFVDALKALTAAIDEKDPYTQGHSQRVSEFSVAIATELGLDAETIHHIRIGSMLHDIGKIWIPDRILKKKGKLTANQYQKMKDHPATGEKIIGAVPMLKEESSAILEHHERLDGSGYPNGLKGDQISLMGRIVAVADAFDAMTSDRQYRQAMSVEEACQRLLSEAGTHFDPMIIQAILKAYQKGYIFTEHERDRS